MGTRSRAPRETLGVWPILRPFLTVRGGGERRSALDDNHSQRHVAEGGSIVCPMLQLIADAVEVESEHVGTLAKIDPELINSQQFAAAKWADLRIGDAL